MDKYTQYQTLLMIRSELRNLVISGECSEVLTHIKESVAKLYFAVEKEVLAEQEAKPRFTGKLLNEEDRQKMLNSLSKNGASNA